LTLPGFEPQNDTLQDGDLSLDANR